MLWLQSITKPIKENQKTNWTYAIVLGEVQIQLQPDWNSQESIDLAKHKTIGTALKTANIEV